MGNKFYDSNGHELFLGGQISKGGEGIVFNLKNNNKYHDCCIKLYHEGKLNKERVSKLEYMIHHSIALPPKNSYYKICWPLDLVFDESKNVIGFIMPLAFKDSEELYKLKGKNASFKGSSKFNRSTSDGMVNRLKLMWNLSKAVEIFHKIENYVFVDLKPQNILFTEDGKISLIDLDSIQISETGIIKFKAPSFTIEYSYPIELDNWSRGKVVSKRWDEFSLSIIIYEVLIGIHPFTGTSKNDIHDLRDLIMGNFFVWGQKEQQFKIIPQPHDYFHLLPSNLKIYFKSSLDINNRSLSKSWVDTLGDAINSSSIKRNDFIKGKCAPIIINFNCNNNLILSGETVTFSWETVSATEIYLDGNLVSHTSSSSIKISKNKRVELKVENKYGKQQKYLDIQVVELPAISEFKSSSSKIKRSDNVELSWSVSHTQKIFLIFEDKRIDVSSKKSYITNPISKNTTYILEAYANKNLTKVIATCVVKVIDPTAIIDFSSNRDFIIETLPVILSWNISNVTKIILMPDNIEVTGKNKIELFPKSTTVYKLIASNELYKSTKSLSIQVQDLPKFNLKTLPVIDLELPNMNNLDIKLGNVGNIHIDLEERIKAATTILPEKKENMSLIDSFEKKINSIQHKLLSITGFDKQILQRSGLSINLYSSFSLLQIVIITCSILSSLLSGYLVYSSLIAEYPKLSLFLGFLVILLSSAINFIHFNFNKSNIKEGKGITFRLILGEISYLLSDISPLLVWIYLEYFKYENIGFGILPLAIAIAIFFIIIHGISFFILKDTPYLQLIKIINQNE